MKQVALKATEEERLAWSEAAGGQSLSAWIRDACNARLAKVQQEGLDEVKESVARLNSFPSVETLTKKGGMNPIFTAQSRPSGYDFSKCRHPALLCSSVGEPRCGSCQEANS